MRKKPSNAPVTFPFRKTRVSRAFAQTRRSFDSLYKAISRYQISIAMQDDRVNVEVVGRELGSRIRAFRSSKHRNVLAGVIGWRAFR
jgi:hypothetical protein